MSLCEEVKPIPPVIFGYLRVSTLEQNTERQKKLIQQNYPNVAKYFNDSCSGKNFIRPG